VKKKIKVRMASASRKIPFSDKRKGGVWFNECISFKAGSRLLGGLYVMEIIPF